MSSNTISINDNPNSQINCPSEIRNWLFQTSNKHYCTSQVSTLSYPLTSQGGPNFFVIHKYKITNITQVSTLSYPLTTQGGHNFFVIHKYKITNITQRAVKLAELFNIAPNHWLSIYSVISDPFYFTLKWLWPNSLFPTWPELNFIDLKRSRGHR